MILGYGLLLVAHLLVFFFRLEGSKTIFPVSFDYKLSKFGRVRTILDMILCTVRSKRVFTNELPRGANLQNGIVQAVILE